MKHAPLILALLLSAASAGSLLLHLGVVREAGRSISHLNQALAQDAASPYRWCDLGEALLQTGQTETARYCFQRAVELGPGVPPVLMRAANFHFILAEQKPALPLTRRILDLTREYDAIIFSSYRRAGVSVAEALDSGIPAGGPAPQSYFLHLLEAGAPEEAALAWRRLARSRSTDDNLAARYVEYLLGRKRPFEAAGIWAEHLGSRRGDYLLANQVFNGGFEFEPLPGPFDWRIVSVQGAQARRDFLRFRSGRSSLSLAFNGERNLAYSHTYQTVVVTPGRWRFSASVRSEDITTDQGPVLRLYDFEDSRRLDVRLDQVKGTTGWTEVTRDFVVPPATRVVRIQLERRASGKLDNRIRGAAWFDAITLARQHR